MSRSPLVALFWQSDVLGNQKPQTSNNHEHRHDACRKMVTILSPVCLEVAIAFDIAALACLESAVHLRAKVLALLFLLMLWILHLRFFLLVHLLLLLPAPAPAFVPGSCSYYVCLSYSCSCSWSFLLSVLLLVTALCLTSALSSMTVRGDTCRHLCTSFVWRQQLLQCHMPHDVSSVSMQKACYALSPCVARGLQIHCVVVVMFMYESWWSVILNIHVILWRSKLWVSFPTTTTTGPLLTPTPQ